MVSETCTHSEHDVGVCPRCGICAHALVLNGVCFYCGADEIALNIKPASDERRPDPAPSDFVPFASVRRKR